MTTTETLDPYALSAEFYDVMASPHWDTKRDVLVTTLRNAAPITDPVLDIGAGSGLSTVTIADTVPEVDIHAVEPSPAMRAALVSRLLTHPEATDRVTVHADRVENIPLPDRIGAAVLMGVLGYLAPETRRAFWTELRPRLTPTAPVVVEYMALTTPASVPEMVIARRRIGTRQTEVRIGGEPEGSDSQHWTMRYVVREGDRVVRDFTAEHIWHTIGHDDLVRDAELHAMTCEQITPTISVLRPTEIPVRRDRP
ncbi:class I SAM-dependent methyltransferase [Nocardia paucivorans]|uniref:class I SAM-dependent methyltransferase n=1 Tax=Nocardia paucivorans TaxID=114259 RepID=UPI0002F35CE7|nr:class I SAM-dependent methyltransferase [Nocardia paucivorans]